MSELLQRAKGLLDRVEKGCGTGTKGNPGFQAGNSCASKGTKRASKQRKAQARLNELGSDMNKLKAMGKKNFVTLGMDTKSLRSMVALGRKYGIESKKIMDISIYNDVKAQLESHLNKEIERARIERDGRGGTKRASQT